MIGVDGCLESIMDIPGARGVTLADSVSGLVIGAAGCHELLNPDADGTKTTEVVRALLCCPALTTALGGEDVTEIIVSGIRGYHLLNLVDGDFEGRLLVHVLLIDGGGNLAMARFRLREILDRLAGGRRE